MLWAYVGCEVGVLQDALLMGVQATERTVQLPLSCTAASADLLLSLQPLHCRVHNGQDLRLRQRGAGGGPPPNLLMGLFGCLIFYDHVTSNAMQSLEEMVQKTELFRSIRVG
jgi:hypothetical protein